MLTIGFYLLALMTVVNCAALASIGVHLWLGRTRPALRSRLTVPQRNEDDAAWPGFAAQLLPRARPVPASTPVPGSTP